MRFDITRLGYKGVFKEHLAFYQSPNSRNSGNNLADWSKVAWESQKPANYQDECGIILFPEARLSGENEGTLAPKPYFTNFTFPHV
ncbi:hypothetical protein DPV78_001458 [Talaromyces pinophilus]|nr:hypothetical protein DPV78_001458 [Talaromyces pinophilus]